MHGRKQVSEGFEIGPESMLRWSAIPEHDALESRRADPVHRETKESDVGRRSSGHELTLGNDVCIEHTREVEASRRTGCREPRISSAENVEQLFLSSLVKRSKVTEMAIDLTSPKKVGQRQLIERWDGAGKRHVGSEPGPQHWRCDEP